jgi:hypothetical protein
MDMKRIIFFLVLPILSMTLSSPSQASILKPGAFVSDFGTDGVVRVPITVEGPGDYAVRNTGAVIDNAGRIIVGVEDDSSVNTHLERLLSNGDVDPAWSIDAIACPNFVYGQTTQVALSPIATGIVGLQVSPNAESLNDVFGIINCEYPDSVRQEFVVKLLGSNGEIDTTFGRRGYLTPAFDCGSFCSVDISSISIDLENRIYIAGHITNFENSEGRIWRYISNSAPDLSFYNESQSHVDNPELGLTENFQILSDVSELIRLDSFGKVKLKFDEINNRMLIAGNLVLGEDNTFPDNDFYPYGDVWLTALDVASNSIGWFVGNEGVIPNSFGRSGQVASTSNANENENNLDLEAITITKSGWVVLVGRNIHKPVRTTSFGISMQFGGGASDIFSFDQLGGDTSDCVAESVTPDSSDGIYVTYSCYGEVYVQHAVPSQNAWMSLEMDQTFQAGRDYSVPEDSDEIYLLPDSTDSNQSNGFYGYVLGGESELVLVGNELSNSIAPYHFLTVVKYQVAGNRDYEIVSSWDYLEPDGISPNVLREKRPIPLYQDPEIASSRQVAEIFSGGQQSLSSQISTLTAMNSSDNFPESFACAGYSDPNCDGFGQYGKLILPTCTGASDGPCIEELKVGRSGSLRTGQFMRSVDNSTSHEFESALEQMELDNGKSITKIDNEVWANNVGYPVASTPGLWNVPSTPNSANATTYLAQATLEVYIHPDGELYVHGLDAAVVPYKRIVRQPVAANTIRAFHPPYVGTAVSDGTDGLLAGQRTSYFMNVSHPMTTLDNPDSSKQVTCAFEESEACGVAVEFSDGDYAQLTMRIPQSLGGWFHGRLGNAQVDLEQISDELNRVSVTASSVDVPIAGAQFELFAAQNSTLRDWWRSRYYETNQGGWNSIENDHLDPEGVGLLDFSIWNANDEHAVSDFQALSSVIGDQAAGTVNMWTFGSMQNSGDAPDCLMDNSKFHGLVATNSMVYQAGLPTFDEGTKSFYYQVAGTHLDMYGDVFRGDYSLVMTAADAECLYGVEPSEYEAVVKVLASNGTVGSATTSTSIDTDWLRVNARNFTFSSPTIGVSLARKGTPPTVQPAPQAPAIQPDPPALVISPNPAPAPAPVTQAPAPQLPPSPQLGIKKKITGTSLAGQIGMSVPPKAKVSLKVAKASKKFCKVSGSKLVTLKAGSCTLTVSVTPKKTKLNKKPKKVSVTTVVKIN